MTKEEELEFDRIYKKQGGIYLGCNPIQNEILFLIEDNKAFLRPRYPRMPYICSSFINNLSLNAAAGLKNGKFFIGINTGTNLLIGDLFSKMMSSKKVHPHIGLIQSEKNETYKLSSIMDTFGLVFDINAESNIFPIDHIRRDFATLYTTIAHEFLIFHEFGHILRGHLGYFNKINNFLYLTEREFVKNNWTALDNRTIEMDADSFAINNIFLKYRNIISNNNLPSRGQKLFFQSLNTFLENVAFAIYGLFRLMDFELFNLMEMEKRLYPPPAIRVSLIFANIIDILNSNKIKDLDIISSNLIQASQKSENAFLEVTYRLDSFSTLAQNVLEGQKYRLEILENWNKIYPLVEPYAFGKLPPAF